MTAQVQEHFPAAALSRSGLGDRLRAGASAGLRDIAPIIVGLAPFGLALGVAVDESSVPDAAGWLVSLLLYGGSSQFAAMSIVDAGGSVVAAVVAGLVINARLLMYGAAMAPRFDGQPTWFRWIGPLTIVDQTFAIIGNRHERDPQWFRGYWLTAGVVLGAAWLSLIGVGILAGAVLPPRLSLDFAVPVMFVAVLVPRLKNTPQRAAALTAAVTTACGLALPHGIGLLLGALLGALAGVLIHRVRASASEPAGGDNRRTA
jgi:4-azaleucine resistance transporter AzlC